MNGNVIRLPARSLKEQFSRGSDAWKEQSEGKPVVFATLAYAEQE